MNFYKKSLLFFCLFLSFLTPDIFATKATSRKRKAKELAPNKMTSSIWSGETRGQLLRNFKKIERFRKKSMKRNKSQKKVERERTEEGSSKQAIPINWEGLKGLIPKELFSLLEVYGFEKLRRDYYYYFGLKSGNKSSRNWDQCEDIYLTCAFYRLGRFPESSEEWKKIAESLPKRTAKQCERRWQFLCKKSKGEVKKAFVFKCPIAREWKDVEDRLLFEVYCKVSVLKPEGEETTAEEWEKIAQELPGRTDQECKERWEWLHKKENREKLIASII